LKINSTSSGVPLKEKAPAIKSRGASFSRMLSGVSGNARADMVRDIIEIVNKVARGLRSGQDPLDDGMPGG
jgi:hypothetical protein